MPLAMVRVFQTFAVERQLRHLVHDLSIESAVDYTPRPGDSDYSKHNDVPWIRRFAAAGGKVIISGNARMMSVPHERLALVEAGMIVIFFENRWNNLKFTAKCSLLLHWWPVVVTTVKRSPSPAFWRIPQKWELDGKLRRVSHEDQAKLRMEKQIAAQPKKARARAKPKPKPMSAQIDMEFPPTPANPSEPAE